MEGSSVSMEAEELTVEQIRHRKRAEKFGVEYVEPKLEKVLSRAELRTQIARERAKGQFPAGFATGIDLFSEEEKAKREARAQKYNLKPEDTLDGEILAKQDLEALRRKRMERFGPVENGLSSNNQGDAGKADVLEPRADVKEGTPLRAEAIHVHGTDQLSTKDLMAYFGAYGPSFVEWVNDSSCAPCGSLLPKAGRLSSPRKRPLTGPRSGVASLGGDRPFPLG